MALAGLTTEQARLALAEHGRNQLPSRDHKTRWQLVLGLFREPMLVLLLVAAGLYTAFGDLGEAIALAISVVAIVAITLVQERRTERALDALRELSSPHARVLRDGAWQRIDS